MKQEHGLQEVVYTHVSYEQTPGEAEEGKQNMPFGSRYGKTYKYVWCQGSSRISQKKKIYFSSVEDAEISGRTLSKLCKK